MMNMRIKELAGQAGLIKKKFSFDQWWTEDLTLAQEKFAELIVKECADRCEKIGFRWHAIDSERASGAKVGAFECAKDLKKHFEVK